MALLKELILTRPREISGAISANRFDYQKNWALCKLLELHKLKTDYVLVLDYHEDVVVLDSENNPTKIAFYQIKTRQKGQWSLKRLLSTPKNKNSIIGILYKNKRKYQNYTESLSLVSNAGFDLKDRNNKSCLAYNKICCNSLEEEMRKQCAQV